MTSVTVERLEGPLDAAIRLPGSKSLTNRALVCAALADGPSRLTGALQSDDTAAMIRGLTALGVPITVSDVDAVGNVEIEVAGRGGHLDGGTVDAALSGTTSRFLLAASLAARGTTTVDGEPPLRARPMGDILDALVSMGAEVMAPRAGHLPATVDAPAAPAASVTVSGAASSQFVSGLLMVGPVLAAGLRIEVDGPLRSVPYVEMTVAVMAAFGATVRTDADRRRFEVEPGGYRGCEFSVEPDASTASYFLAAAALCGGRVEVPGLGSGSLQGDVGFADVLARMGARVVISSDSIAVVGDRLRGVEVDMGSISDTAQTAAAVAAFAEGPTTIEGIGFIRAKETDRIAAVVTELRRCGVGADELDDGIRIEPRTPHPASIHTYDDHRMAMAFSLIGLRAGGIEILDADCVAKTVPNYWALLDQLREATR